MDQELHSQTMRANAFKRLHDSGCFVLPNPWDQGTAAFLRHLGYQALATTSAGLSFSLGMPDQVGVISLEKTLQHIAQIVSATSLPVNADFQEGFASAPEKVLENVNQCVATGVAGLSIEDATGRPDAPLFERQLAIERIRAARMAIDGGPVPVVLTARCEAWLVGAPNPFETAVDRLVAFADAGADCLFAPGIREPKQIQALVRAVHPKPVNVLIGSPIPELTVARLADLGVRRISVGSAFARVAWGAFMRVATNILEKGVFDDLGHAASFDAINSVFTADSDV